MEWPTRPYVSKYRSGDVFSFDICDQSSEIRVTAFDEMCKDFQNQLIVGRVYCITHGDVLLADARYNALQHPFYIRINKKTTFKPIADVPFTHVPLIHVQLVKIGSLRTAGILSGKKSYFHL